MSKRIVAGLLLLVSIGLVPAIARAQDPAVARVVLQLSNIECSGCAKAVSASLRELDGVSRADVSEQTKRVVVTFDLNQVTVQQLAEAVASTRPLRGKPYAAGLLIHVAPLNRDTTPRLAAACKPLKGVAGCDVVDANGGIIAVRFDRLETTPEMTGPAGVRQEAVLKALQAAGVTAQLVAPEKP